MTELQQPKSRAWARFDSVISGLKGGQVMHRSHASGRKSPAQQAAQAEPSRWKKLGFYFKMGMAALVLGGAVWGFNYAKFHVGKDLNYWFAYGSDMQRTVCEMVDHDTMNSKGREICERMNIPNKP